MITKPECLRRDNADDARLHFVQHSLSLAKITPKFSLTITGMLAINMIVFATGSLALRGLTSFEPKLTLCINVQSLGF